MSHISITAADPSIVAPGQLTLQISAPDRPWAGLPLAFGDVTKLAPPHVSGSWCSVNQFPLPYVVNVDGAGNASVVVDVRPPAGTPLGTYTAAFTLGYVAADVSCQSLSVSVQQLQVPDLSGLTVGDAQAAVSAAHLQFGDVTGVEGDDCRVIAQDPPPGTSVAVGTLVSVQLAPTATPVSQVTFVNCTINDYDIWINDRTESTWTKWPGSPLARSMDIACPPPGAPVATITLTDGHYYNIEAAWSNFPFTPSQTHWHLPHGALRGSSIAPVMNITLTPGSPG